MAINSNSFFNYTESRALSGYKSAWLYKLPDEDKYHLLAATTSVPYVFGDKDTYEFDILQSPTKGQVEGKMSLDKKDVEVLHHRDNAYRFDQLKGKTIDFMAINAEFVGYTFNGTLDYRPNDAEADLNTATVSITPMSADATPIYDARTLIEETLVFKYSIPATQEVGKAIDFDFAIAVTSPSYTIKYYDATNKVWKDAIQSTDYVISGTKATEITFKTASRLYSIEGSADGYASWTTTVYVEPSTSTQ
jgi:hypothetical protein